MVGTAHSPTTPVWCRVDDSASGGAEPETRSDGPVVGTRRAKRVRAHSIAADDLLSLRRAITLTVGGAEHSEIRTGPVGVKTRPWGHGYRDGATTRFCVVRSGEACHVKSPTYALGLGRESSASRKTQRHHQCQCHPRPPPVDCIVSIPYPR